MKVAIITATQSKELQGKEFSQDSYFNPIQDIDDNWVISEQEIELATIPPYEWLKELPLIEFKPKKTTII
jgi:hypothetical protein